MFPVDFSFLFKFLSFLGNFILDLVLAFGELFFKISDEDESDSLFDFGFEFILDLIEKFLRAKNLLDSSFDKLMLLLRS